MAEQKVDSGGSITEKLKSLITQTNAWSQALEAAAKEQKASSNEIVGLMDKVTQAMQAGIEVAQQLTGQMESVGAVAARMRAEFQQTSGAASNAFAMGQSRNVNPFAASDYISGASQLTTEQKAEFLRIVTDQDKAALDKMVNDYKKQINAIYTDEYKSIKTQRDQLDQQREAIGKKIEDELAAIKGKEDTTNYRSTIKLIEQQRQEMSRLGNQSALLTQRIGQFDQDALRLQGQVAILNRAWSDKDMQRQLAASNESSGYTQKELLFLVNKALETGAGTQFDKVALTELINKLNNATPFMRYQLDLTVGDQKLSAFTELSPEKFLDALLKARGTAI